jgi:transcriptional regulator with XRE-family HTH domain
MVDIKLMSAAEISVELGHRLKSRRLALRMTQEELAARADLNVGTKRTGVTTLMTLKNVPSLLDQ